MTRFLHSAKIMVVDDTPENLRLLVWMLTKENYTVQAFPRGKLAISAAQEDPPDLLLLDINMPEMNGYEVCERFKAIEKLAEIPIIFLSAMSEMEDKLVAFRSGGVDYITKPFHFEEVRARVETHLKIRYYQIELHEHNLHLQKLVDEQVLAIVAAKEEISHAQLATILAMSKIAEARDENTGRHIERTQHYCRALALALRGREEYKGVMTDDFIGNLFHASPLHDIGKVAIPDAILLKPGKLTEEEFEIMKTHTVIGAHNLADVQKNYPNNMFINMGLAIARSHHERWDGRGYPDGLAGNDIPLASRIMALADVYDALRSERCYKAAFSHEKTCEIISNENGSQFDPFVVNAFLRIEQEFFHIHEGMNQ